MCVGFALCTGYAQCTQYVWCVDMQCVEYELHSKARFKTFFTEK